MVAQVQNGRQRSLVDESQRGRLERRLSDIKTRVTHDIVVLDSALASALLQGNVKNRSLKPRQVARLRAAQRDGKWEFNGEPICVADTGRLLNGQHRCAMVVEGGEPIVVLLVRGLPEAVFSTYDTGTRRTAGDVLHILGQTNCSSLASALAWVEKYYCGKMESTDGVQPFAVEEMLEEHVGLVDSVKFCASKRRVKVRPGLMSAMHYLFRKVDVEQADKFVEDFDSGVGLSRDDSVYLLRERMRAQESAKAKLPAGDVAALVIKAWNFRYRRATCRFLRWQSEGGEEFPRIEGLRL